MSIQYDKQIRYAGQQSYEIKGLRWMNYPQDLSPSKTYIAGVWLERAIDVKLGWRLGTLTGGACPKKFPLIPEGYNRYFFNSKNLLIVLDFHDLILRREVFEHSRNAMFSRINKVFGEKISPSNYEEICFIGFQNDDHHWKMRVNHYFTHVDLYSRGK